MTKKAYSFRKQSFVVFKKGHTSLEMLKYNSEISAAKLYIAIIPDFNKCVCCNYCGNLSCKCFIYLTWLLIYKCTLQNKDLFIYGQTRLKKILTCMFIIVTVLDRLHTTMWSGFFGKMWTENTGRSTEVTPASDLKVAIHSVVLTDQTLTVPSDDAL